MNRICLLALLLGTLACLNACTSTSGSFIEEFELPVLGETSSHKELVVPPGYVAPEVSEAFEIPGSERSMRREAM
ncbi:MAG: hypothetical protein ACNYNY_02800, partial [Candidatus Oxydemutatoraceae bacterium WSBS_2016_MAG_OTU14]